MPNIETNTENEEQLIEALNSNVTIGLFGTCGGSKWREPFIERYDSEGIAWFNPQKANWNKEKDPIIENINLIEDDIILFPVTSETYGSGSLIELGFVIDRINASANSGGKKQRIIVYVEPDVDEKLKENAVAAKESVRGRKLASKKLEINPSEYVYVANSLEEMLELSVSLHRVATMERKNKAVRRFAKKSEYEVEMFKIINQNENFRNFFFSLSTNKRNILINSLDFMDYIIEHQDDLKTIMALSNIPDDKLQILAKHPEKIKEIVDFELTHEEIIKAHAKNFGGVDR